MISPLFPKFFPSDVLTYVTDRRQDYHLQVGQRKLNKEQRIYLSWRFNLTLPKMVTIRQVHGNRVLYVDKKAVRLNQPVKDADGAIANERGLALVVRTADCLPIFLYDKANRAIGLVHAGWKGSQKGIIVEAMRLMNKHWHTIPSNILVGFGPAIRPCCYQVGAEFKKFFPREVKKKADGHYLDLIGVNKNQLKTLGIKESNMNDCGICTCCDQNYFSYRREGRKAGRMLSMIMLRDQTSKKRR